MGVIEKQTIKGSFFSYLGALIGFLNTGLLMPKLLHSQQFGLINVLISLSLIFSQVGSLGINYVTARYFPYFRDPKKRHHGFLSLALTVGFIGFLIFLGFYHFGKGPVTQYYDDQPLLANNFGLIPILTLFILFFSILDSYNRALYDAVTGTFLREFFIRFLNTLLILAFWGLDFSFTLFLEIYVAIQCLPTVLLTLYMAIKKTLFLAPWKPSKSPVAFSDMRKVALFGIIAGFSGIAIVNIDRPMVTHFLGLQAAGVYSIGALFGTIILLPSRVLKKISTTVLADAWQKEDLPNIKEIYIRSCRHQLMIGLGAFLVIWSNRHGIFEILPSVYSQGELVIFFLGLSSLVEMFAGVSGTIVAVSPWYRYQTFFLTIFMILLVVTNLIFIPRFGVWGAAFASLLANIVFSSLKFLFLLFKFRLQPYSIKTFVLLTIGGISYLIMEMIPSLPSPYVDVIFRSALLAIIYGGTLLVSGIEPDLWKFLKRYLVKQH